MSYIKFHCPLGPTLSKRDLLQVFNPQKLIRLPSDEPERFLKSSRNLRIATTTKARGLSSHVLASIASSPAPNLTVLLSTSAGLLMVYWVANFVVPEVVYKDLQSENTNDGKEPNNTALTGDDRINPSSSVTKSKSFDSAKR